jgi:hypothetical protein
MNPNIDKFPMPNTDPSGANIPSAEFSAQNPVTEQMPSRESTSFAPTQPAMATSPIMPPNNTLASQASPVASAQSVPQTAGLPALSGAGEDLEKKWIEVAKTIVERTKDNPYLQSQQLSKAGIEFRKQTGRSLDLSKE